MKKSFIYHFVFLISTTLLFSCQKVKESVKESLKIRIPVYMEFEIVVPPIEDTSILYEIDGYKSIDVDQLIQESNSKLSAKNIRSVTIHSMDVTIPSAYHFPEDNFTVLEFFHVSLSSNQNPEWLRIAEISFPDHPHLLEMDVNQETDLNPYFDAQSFHYLFQMKALRPTTQIIKASVKVKFIVEAGL